MEDSSRIPFITHRGATITTCDGDLLLGMSIRSINLTRFGIGNSWLHSFKGLNGEKYGLYVLNSRHIELGHMALRRMIKVAEDTNAAMVYCDHFNRMPDGSLIKHLVIDYQEGSLRDDFDFGPVVMINCYYLFKACMEIEQEFEKLEYAGFYAVRLALSRLGKIVHIPEYLYTCDEIDLRSSGERIFDYQLEKESEKQKEMEAVCTWHLTKIGAYLPPERYEDVNLSEGKFPVECSVIIPVLNRKNTISDAIKSVLAQEAPFKFNLIVVDNHSTDGTTEVIDEFADDPRLIHIIPERHDLGIGGCWNLAIYDERCGRFAIGLDSDDLFATPHVLETMIQKFIEEKAAMVVGSYKIVDYNLQEVPPGIIAHREWTLENGRNNLLRVNGIGGPRAFFTHIYRHICLPCSSYGEDYGMGLMLSRQYRVGRVWDVMTLNRRGDDNTDANLTIEQENANNLYKDRLRTWEVQARKKLNEPFPKVEFSSIFTQDQNEAKEPQGTQPSEWYDYKSPKSIEKNSIEERIIILSQDYHDKDLNSINLNDNLHFDLGFDELDCVEFLMAVEADFDIIFSDAENSYLWSGSLGDIAKCIRYHLEQNN